MQVVLIRHGATDWNLQGRCQGSTDRLLCADGERQAEELAAAFKTEKISAIYSSGLARARRTAQWVSRLHGLPVQIENDFRELDHGALEGLTFDEIKIRYPDFIRVWRSAPAELQVPGGERLIDVQRRAWNGLSRLVQSHAHDDTLIVVSHNFPILGIICQITGTPLNSYRSFRLEPCGHTRLLVADGAWRVTHLNGEVYAPGDRRADRR